MAATLEVLGGRWLIRELQEAAHFVQQDRANLGGSDKEELTSLVDEVTRRLANAL
jgi:hypothetical protein